MKRFFFILVSVILAFPVFGSPVSAEEALSFANLEDGHYVVDVSYLKSEEDSPSAMARYLGGSVFLEVVDGKTELTLTINDSNAVTLLTIDDVKNTKSVKDGNKRYETFPIEKLDTLHIGYVEYVAEYQGGIHNGKAEFRIVLDEESITPAEASDKPGFVPDEEEEAFANLEDGHYFVNANYMHSKEEKPSAMARYLESPVFLSVVDGKAELTITINDSETVTLLQVDGKEPIETKKEENLRHETYAIDNLNTLHNGYVEYVAEYQGGIHNGKAEFRIVLDEESVTPVEASDKPGFGIADEDEKGLADLKDGHYVVDVSYLKSEEDSPSTMARYLGSSVFLEVVDGKVELTLTINDSDAVTLLTIDDVKNIESVKDGNKRYETFPIEKLDTLHIGYVEYVAQIPGRGVHNGKADFRIVLDEESVTPAEATDKPGFGIVTEEEPEEIAIESGEEAKANKGDTVVVENETVIQLPSDLEDEVTIKVVAKSADELKNLDNLKVAGKVYEFSGLEGYKGEEGFILTMTYDASKYDADEVDIYYYDEKQNKWIPQQGEVKDGKITIKTSHFSTYGVFAVEKEEEPKEDEQDEVDNVKVYAVNYEIYHDKIDDVSTADQYFTGVAHLIEVDGKKYLQITSNAPQLIVYLRSEFGEFEIVETNDQGAVYQVEVPGNFELTDEFILEMKISVPGFYEAEHVARVIFDVESVTEVDPSTVPVPKSEEQKEELNEEPGDDSNGGPSEETDEKDPQPTKPSDLDGDEKGNKDQKGDNTDKKGLNPKTGENTNIMLYLLLLIASAIPLAIKAKRRFV